MPECKFQVEVARSIEPCHSDQGRDSHQSSDKRVAEVKLAGAQRGKDDESAEDDTGDA